MARREGVKLDMRGLGKIETIFGKGLTFDVGFFNKEQVKKIYNLEFGTPNQVERPVMSNMYSKNCPTRDKILVLITKLVNHAVRGGDISVTTATNITKVVQDHFLDQLFNVVPLKKTTINRKKRDGAIAPDKVGLDTFDMVDSIKTRIKGGRKSR